jgi:hypothetical protein
VTNNAVFTVSSTATGTGTSGNTTVAVSALSAGTPTTNYITYTTSSPHGLWVGATVTVSGITGTTAYNTTNGIVIAVPSSTTFVLYNSTTGGSPVFTTAIVSYNTAIATPVNSSGAITSPSDTFQVQDIYQNPRFGISNTSTAVGSPVWAVNAYSGKVINVANGSATGDAVNYGQLSTFTGATSIATVGTITAGVWNATPITNAYLANSAVTVGSTSISIGSTATAVSGLTLSGSANTFTNIGNGSLTNSSVTVGSTTIALGSTATAITGLTLSGTANTFTGISPSSLSASAVTVNGVAIGLGASGTITAAAGTLTGTSLNSTVTGSSLTSVGTITSGVWNGTAITNTYLANPSVTIGSTNVALGATATAITGLNLSGTANTFSGIPASALAASAVTVGSTSIGLGGTATAVSGLTLTSPILNNPLLNSPLENVTIVGTGLTAGATGTATLGTSSVILYTASASGAFTLNVSTTASPLTTGQSATVAFMVLNGATAYAPTAITINGSAPATLRWQGTGATYPSTADASCYDAYTITVIQTAASTYTVFASQTKF